MQRNEIDCSYRIGNRPPSNIAYPLVLRQAIMNASTCQLTAPKLSICISTFNRADFILDTLDSIVSQLTDECEVVVLDSASTDDTPRLVPEYAYLHDRVRYVRQTTNNGVDRDYDHTVEIARGEYCWLMTDDDLLKPGAVDIVLRTLRQNFSLVIVNLELRDRSMSKVLLRRWISIDDDCLYMSRDFDRLFVDVCNGLQYIGSVIIKREIWLARLRTAYYGSRFVHVGVIFQEPLPSEAFLIAEPLISYRTANAQTWSTTAFETFMISWPSLVWSLAPSEWAKSRVCSPEPWRSLRGLLKSRALGRYSVMDYRQWVRPRLPSILKRFPFFLAAVIPGTLLNMYLIFYYAVVCPRHEMWREVMLNGLMASPYYHFRDHGLRGASNGSLAA